MYQYHTAYLSGQIAPEGEDFEINVVAAIRDAVGPSIGVLLDAHGHDNVPTCVRICRLDLVVWESCRNGRARRAR
jgi:L-alanine-DL-glutamate epimerase-like enolase superfamily enzyme